ncbi:glycosyltransferase family 4 protein [Castellaniella sp.]|uniref:glycosyltransferase family 4 protein n=1 Tax=Castellaniella sp. TaxID=1955812 RepID=UPI003A8CB146
MKLILSIETIRYPLTGIGRYTYELAKYMRGTTRSEDVLFFTGAGFTQDLPVVAESVGSGYRLKRFVQSSRLLTWTYQVFRDYSQRQLLRDYRDCIFHGPNFQVPNFGGRKIATFHDLSPFTWAHCHAPERARFMRSECLKTIARADALIAVSECTRQAIAEYFSFPLERIHAVPLASAAEFHPRQDAELSALEGYGLKPRTYTLFVGTIEPRKNLTVLLQAYSRLPVAQRTRTPLVLSGHPGWNSDAIHQQIKQGEREGWVRYLGFMPAQDLPVLYAGALLFAFPSSYEGFGLPPLEAMASGVPVICSNSSSLPEVVGDAALTHDPEDVEGLTALLGRGLLDDAWRRQAIQAGLARAALFSWDRCGEQTLAVYRRVAERS